MYLVYFRSINEIKRKPWASADSDESWIRKGLESEIYIFWSPPKAISHFSSVFHGFSNIRKSKGSHRPVSHQPTLHRWISHRRFTKGRGLLHMHICDAITGPDSYITLYCILFQFCQWPIFSCFQCFSSISQNTKEARDLAGCDMRLRPERRTRYHSLLLYINFQVHKTASDSVFSFYLSLSAFCVSRQCFPSSVVYPRDPTAEICSPFLPPIRLAVSVCSACPVHFHAVILQPPHSINNMAEKKRTCLEQLRHLSVMEHPSLRDSTCSWRTTEYQRSSILFTDTVTL